jgi:hypothetical protein
VSTPSIAAQRTRVTRAQPAAISLPPDCFTPRSLLAAKFWNLATRHGLLDLEFAPRRLPRRLRPLAPRHPARRRRNHTLVVPVAALEGIHESERRANRPKDRAYLESADTPA